MQERSGEITTVGIVTRERLPSLLACLESYLANCRRHSRTPEFVVADDSAATASKDVRAALVSLDAVHRLVQGDAFLEGGVE